MGGLNLLRRKTRLVAGVRIDTCNGEEMGLVFHRQLHCLVRDIGPQNPAEWQAVQIGRFINII